MQTSSRRAYEILRSAIRTGYFPAGQQLVEHELAKALSTSRNALRVALQLLAEEGVVERNPRSGTIITSAMVQITLNEQDMDSRVHTSGRIAEVPTADVFEDHVLDERVLPTSPYVRRRMQSDEDFVRMHERLITVRGEPHHVWIAYVSADVDYSSMRPNGARLEVFRERFGVEFGRSEDNLEAVPCELRTSRLLQVAPGSPILLRETRMFGVDGRVHELLFRYNRGDRVSFRIEHSETPYHAEAAQ
ncbi:GntR family transcriptional regulator [Mycolicibacterium baixiangningiae]|uniref:GntR family transcriptional regulator n=1 Tax=Mycolicibacterium baixiangningiae TaxID=2761578 RepID=UPI0018D09802|nr:GntR family transcriptional regulator [Mycolicibacterium baixiangningiae]